MDNFIDKKRKLLEIKNKLDRMPNIINKADIVDSYANLFTYYKEINGICVDECTSLDLDDDVTKKYDRYVEKKTRDKISEISKLSPYLYQRFNKLIKLYKENDFCSFEFGLMDKVNKEEMYDYLAEFLRFLGRDVCILYNKMVTGNNIYVATDYDILGVSMNSIKIDNPCMIVSESEKYFNFYVTLLHELGHCYQFYLQRNHTHFESFNAFTEVTSTLFENLFCEFLKSKNKYMQTIKDYELEDNIYFLNTLSSSKLLCKLMMNHDLLNVDAFNLSYKTSFPYYKMMREMINDCGYIMDNKHDFSLTEFHYSIGNIIAKYFIDKMNKDFKNTWKEYKDFICMVDNYPLKEILDKYFDMNLMEDNIKTFIKSYHNR